MNKTLVKGVDGLTEVAMGAVLAPQRVITTEISSFLLGLAFSFHLSLSSFLGSYVHDRVGIRKFGRQDEDDRNDSSAPQGSHISLNHPTQSNLLHGAWSHLEDTGMSMDGC